MFFFRPLLILAGTLLLAIAARAEGLERSCEFEARPEAIFFSKMPAEIIGWVDCKKIKAGQNIFMAAVLENPSRSDLIKFFKRYRATVDPVPSKDSIIRDEAIEGGAVRRIEIHSQQQRAHVTHHLFAKKTASGTVVLASSVLGAKVSLDREVRTALLSQQTLAQVLSTKQGRKPSNR